MRRLTLALAVAAFAFWSTAASLAQTYPSRPITVVVPFPPGGQVDTVARLLLDRVRASLGQPLIVENVGGASGVDRHRSCGPLGARRLHAQHGQLDEPRRLARDVSRSPMTSSPISNRFRCC